MNYSTGQNDSKVSNNYPVGQDSWNQSKESKEHPELHSTGHGTSDREWSTDTVHEDKQTEAKGTRKLSESKSTEGFGHTVHHGHSTRSIKRDLNDI
ncbi:hypothetical protein BY458DRAFT_583548 [Sporodiniella umbellata]|nr:hypothetical protein BY458DRAFT_583548 [Sporodiniella umbellata]